jgi:predicted NBD/HSP70 family sugar kinase
MDYFAGLDVSVKNTSICIVDDTGRLEKRTSFSTMTMSALCQ